MVERKIVIKNLGGDKFIRADVNISDNGSTLEISVFSESLQASTQVISEFDKNFPIVKASELSINDTFLTYQPFYLDFRPNKLKAFLLSELNNGNTFVNFRCPVMAPSFNESGHITFKENTNLAYGISLEQWMEEAKNFMVTKNSRIGTMKNYYSLLGVFIKTLVEDYNFELRNAWDIACNMKYSDGITLLNNCDSNVIGLWYAISGYKKIIRKIKLYDFDILNNTSVWDLPTSNKINDIYEKQNHALGWIICDE